MAGFRLKRNLKQGPRINKPKRKRRRKRKKRARVHTLAHACG